MTFCTAHRPHPESRRAPHQMPIRPVDRRRQSAAHRILAPGQIFTDWACI